MANPAIIFEHAYAAQQRGDLGNAAAGYATVLEQSPDHFDALHLLGGIAMAKGHFSLADELMQKALTKRPDFAPLLSNLGLLARLQNDHQTAAAYFERAVASDPLQPMPRQQLAELALAAQDLSAAAAWLAPMLGDRPSAGILNAAIQLALREGELWQAERYWLQLQQQAPTHPHTLNLQALIAKAKGDYAGASAQLAKLVATHPAQPAYQLNHALAALCAGQWAEGFAAYRARHDLAKLQPQIPLWDGAPTAHLLVHGEQGIGDSILALRFLPQLRRMVETLVVTLPPTLLNWAQENFNGGNFPDIKFLSYLAPVPVATAQTALLTVPHHLDIKNHTDIPTSPYLQAAPHRIARWQQRLATLPRPWVGVVGAGNPNFITDNLRSPGLATVVEAISPQLSHGSLLILPQLGTAPAAPHLHDWRTDLTDYAETAALLSLLDCVITSDTSVAHATGALGKAGAVLLHHDPFWVYPQLSAWYPSLTALQQTSPADWGSVWPQLQAYLRQF